jgi:hypothetical protein
MSTNSGLLTLKSPSTLAFAAVALLLLCGCHKQEDPTAEASVRLLQDIKATVSATHRPGEAFLVLKSDAVIYLADMPVFCLNADFKRKFDQFKTEWEQVRVGGSDMAAAQDPDYAAQLKSADARIVEASALCDAAPKGAEGVVAQSIAQLEADLKAQQAKQQTKEAAYREYLTIAQPLELGRTQAEAKMKAAGAAKQALANTMLAAINEVITADRLAIPKLPKLDADELFKTATIIQREQGSSSFQGFGNLMVRHEPDPDNPGLFRNSYAGHLLPAELKGTRAEPEIYAAFEKWTGVEDEHIGAAQELAAVSAALAAALIPWSNRWDIPADSIPDFLAGRAVTDRAIQQRVAKIAELKAGPAAQALVAEEVRQRKEDANKTLQYLKKQRDELVQTATKNFTEQTRLKFAAKFKTLIATEAKNQVRTGSRGDFSVPATAAYLYAERHRENGEHLVWLAPVDPLSARVQLSNSNTTASGNGINEFWMLDYQLP